MDESVHDDELRRRVRRRMTCWWLVLSLACITTAAAIDRNNPPWMVIVTAAMLLGIWFFLDHRVFRKRLAPTFQEHLQQLRAEQDEERRRKAPFNALVMLATGIGMLTLAGLAFWTANEKEVWRWLAPGVIFTLVGGWILYSSQKT